MKLTKEVVQNFTQTIMDLHEHLIINYSGGEHGIRDLGGLEHAVTLILTDYEKYKERPFYVSAKAYQLLATRHYFVDGNKRTSHLLAKVLLLDTGYRFVPKYTDAVQFIIDIAAKKKTLKEIEEWIKANVSKKKLNVQEYMKELDDDVEDMKKWKQTQS